MNAGLRSQRETGVWASICGWARAFVWLDVYYAQIKSQIFPGRGLRNGTMASVFGLKKEIGVVVCPV